MNKKFVYQVGNNKKVILWCTANQISRCKKPIWKKVMWIVDVCHNVRFACGSIHTVCDNADIITEDAKITNKSINVPRLSQSYWNEPY